MITAAVVGTQRETAAAAAAAAYSIAIWHGDNETSGHRPVFVRARTVANKAGYAQMRTREC